MLSPLSNDVEYTGIPAFKNLRFFLLGSGRLIRLRVIAGRKAHIDGFVTQQQIIEPRYEKTNILVSSPVRHKPGCTAVQKMARGLKFRI